MDAHSYVSAPMLKTQSIAQQNKCTVRDMVGENFEGCKSYILSVRNHYTPIVNHAFFSRRRVEPLARRGTDDVKEDMSDCFGLVCQRPQNVSFGGAV
jgi:hypothetical protein